MATVSNVLSYARNLCQTDSNALTDTVGLTFINDALQTFTRDLIDRGIDAAQTQESYTTLTSGQGTYAWPSDMWALKTVEVNFTDTTQQNYIQAQPVDVANLQGNTSFDFLRKNQSQQWPLIDNRGDTFEVFPTPVATNPSGIKIFYFKLPTDYSTTSDTISYPQTLDYRALSAKVAALYSRSLEKFDLEARHEGDYQARLKKIIEILAPGTQQPIRAVPLQISGWQY